MAGLVAVLVLVKTAAVITMEAILEVGFVSVFVVGISFLAYVIAFAVVLGFDNKKTVAGASDSVIKPETLEKLPVLTNSHRSAV